MIRWLPDIWCCYSVFNLPDTDILITWHLTPYTNMLSPTHDYHFTGTWHLLSYHVPKFLYLTCSSWYNNLVNSQKLIIVDTIIIIRQFIQEWGKLMGTDIVSMFMMVLSVARPHSWDSLGGHQVFSWAMLTPLLSWHPSRFATSPGAYSCGISDTLLQFGRTISQVSGETFQFSSEYFLVVVLGKYETHSKYGSSISISF